MKAMLLAAGRGKRMRPLTDTLPKPLLKIGTQSLIEYHLRALGKAGISDIVINLAYKGDLIRQQLGSGERYGMNIMYSDEGHQALETAGGIIKALPLLGNDPFLVVNADIWTDFAFADITLRSGLLAHLIMVDNPAHHPEGDFALSATGLVKETGSIKLTYSGIGLYHPALFQNLSVDIRPLRPLLVHAMAASGISGQHYRGAWRDIGTPESLHAVRETLVNP